MSANFSTNDGRKLFIISYYDAKNRDYKLDVVVAKDQDDAVDLLTRTCELVGIPAWSIEINTVNEITSYSLIMEASYAMYKAACDKKRQQEIAANGGCKIINFDKLMEESKDDG